MGDKKRTAAYFSSLRASPALLTATDPKCAKCGSTSPASSSQAKTPPADVRPAPLSCRDSCNHAICQIDRGPLITVGLDAAPRIGIAVRPRTTRRSKLDPDYAAGKQAIEAKNWRGAIKSLSSAALRDTRNADIQNYLGYAYRNSGQLEPPFKHYGRALQLNPRHRGAHEYVGEAYLMVNNLSKAEEHLAALQKICLIPCEEYEDLKKQIDVYRKRAGK